MPRSTYNEERGSRTYPDASLRYDQRYEGREITAETEFDEVRIECAPDAWVIGRAWVYNDDTKVSQIPGININSILTFTNRTMRFLADDPK